MTFNITTLDFQTLDFTTLRLNIYVFQINFFRGLLT